MSDILCNHSPYIQIANRLAKTSVTKGNHPFGAILVYKDNIVASAENTVETDYDPTQHAELRVVSKAAKKANGISLKDHTLYSSTEPCAMCAGAIYWAGIRKVVYGCSAEDLREFTSGSFLTNSSHIFSFGREKVEVIGSVSRNECMETHRQYWGK